jgi:hypothetical protein
MKGDGWYDDFLAGKAVRNSVGHHFSGLFLFLAFDPASLRPLRAQTPRST